MASEEKPNTNKPVKQRDYSRGIKLEIDSDDDVIGFLHNRVEEYRNGEHKGEDLWWDFYDDFKNFTKSEDFLRAGIELPRKLRDVLRSRGVYIPKDKKSIAGNLVALINFDEPPVWPKSDKDYEKTMRLLETDLERLTKLEALEESKKKLAAEARDIPRSYMNDPDTSYSQKFNQKYTQGESSSQSPRIYDCEQDQNESRILNYRPHGYSKQIVTLAKLYDSQSKYSGNGDTFDYKFDIFLKNCENADVPREGLKTAFRIMLKDEALDFYNNFMKFESEVTLTEICRAFKDKFEGPEYQRTLLTNWNKLTFESVKLDKKNIGKSLAECLQILTRQLALMQHGLDKSLRNDVFIHNKIVTACEDESAFKNVCERPSITLNGLLSDLRSAAEFHDRIIDKNFVSDNLFTDRRYHKYPKKDKTIYPDTRAAQTRNKKPQKCIVCHKEGCWSTNHTKIEKDQAFEKFKNNVNQNLSHKFAQYCLEIEGEPSNDSNNLELQSDNDQAELEDSLETFIFDNITQSNPTQKYNSTYMTEAFGEIDGAATVMSLSNLTTAHAIVRNFNNQDYEINSTRYGPNIFQGIVIDTGAAHYSTGGHDQWTAIQKRKNLTLNEAEKGKVTVQFGIGSTSSIGSVVIDTPIGKIKFHIVEANTPFLLCLRDMDKLGAYFNNITNKIHFSNQTYPVIRRYGHAFMVWDEALTNFITQYSYLSEVELRQLHRRFGHPSVRRFVDLLKNSSHDIDSKVIARITKYCKLCQKFGSSPRRFKFTLRDPTLQFNHTIIVDIMYIEDNGNKPVLHIVDEATRFQAARWLKDISSQTVWNTLKSCWIDTYLGPPDVISHDAGSQFMSKEFQHLASSMAVSTEPVPIEAHNSIGIVERYHHPLRRAYKIIAEELKGVNSGVNKDMVLQMAIKAVNDTAGPGGLVPTLLVFGAYPKMTKLDSPAPSIAERSRAIENAMKEVTRLRNERQIKDALRQRNGPVVDDVSLLPLNSKVWVWRERQGWTGPHVLISVDKYDCTIESPNGPLKFRLTSVKPYFEDDQQTKTDDEDHRIQDGQLNKESQAKQDDKTDKDELGNDNSKAVNTRHISHNEDTNFNRQHLKRERMLPARYRNNHVLTAFITNKEKQDMELSQKLREEGKIIDGQQPFFLSRQKEVDGLLSKGVFEIVNNKPKSCRLFNSRFVDEIKGKATDTPFEKSRLVIQAYNDEEKSGILTQSPTIQRVSQRIIICLAVSTGLNLYLRDVSQAYVQSTTNLNRKVFARPPKDIRNNFPENSMFEIKKPLYGIPEAGLHWFQTYQKHHIEKLCMDQSTYDPCLLFTKIPEIFGVVGIQTDDTLFVGNPKFVELENNEIIKAKIQTKPVECLLSDNQLIFNGGIITQDNSSIYLQPKNQGDKIKLINTKDLSFKNEYVAQRARGAYIATVCQPEAMFDLSFAAQSSQNPSQDDAKTLNKRLQWQIDNKNKGLKFIPIILENSKIFIFVDASFANNKDCSSQIGFVIMLATEDPSDNKQTNFRISGNIIHWSSIKCKRITRSVLASELYATVHGIDSGIVIKTTIDKILEQLKIPPISLVLCTDSYSLYDCLTKLGTTREKRLMIDVMALRQSFERREITEVRWIDGRDNPADAMTKRSPCKALTEIIATNKLIIRVDGWVERSPIVV